MRQRRGFKVSKEKVEQMRRVDRLMQDIFHPDTVEDTPLEDVEQRMQREKVWLKHCSNGKLVYMISYEHDTPAPFLYTLNLPAQNHDKNIVIYQERYKTLALLFETEPLNLSMFGIDGE